jgi:nitronate monooxygenase
MTPRVFCDRFGLALPVVQAPMAGVQDSALALAVSGAGGLGSLPCAMLTPEGLLDHAGRLAATGRPYNLNFFSHTAPAPDAQRQAAWGAALAPYYQAWGLGAPDGAVGPARTPFSHALADLIEPLRPPVLSFHFGLPAADLLARVRGWGSRVIGCATTVTEARWLAERGVDAIVAQGLEAGGHRGLFLSDDLGSQLGTFALLPQVVAAVPGVPVIAAGGVADARGVAAALALGASAVQVGTAYLLCLEATTSAVHRAALSGAGARHTALTNLFSGRPARGIVNRLMRELGPMSPLAPAFPLAAAAVAPFGPGPKHRAWGISRPCGRGRT